MLLNKSGLPLTHGGNLCKVCDDAGKIQIVPGKRNRERIMDKFRMLSAPPASSAVHSNSSQFRVQIVGPKKLKIIIKNHFKFSDSRQKRQDISWDSKCP